MSKEIEPKKQDILDALSVIQDPDLNDNIVALNFIKNLTIQNGNVSFSIELTTPACPVKDMFKREAERVVSAVPQVSSVTVTMSAQAPKAFYENVPPGLKKVANIIAVSSCKGGVGKSFTAINLAYAIAQTGAKVGIFDADVYGPSLPTMIKTNQSDLRVNANSGLIQPNTYQKMKLMSFGYTRDEEGQQRAAMLRGPMVSQVITQLITQTEWGELDYLILDMPPGTGDVQLTIGQLVPLTAAVIVTTPQVLSFIDVVKGIEQFDSLNVPTIAAVENMSHYVLPDGTKDFVFGEGSIKRLMNEFGFNITAQVPLNNGISMAGDAGRPFMQLYPTSEPATIMTDFAAEVVREISRLRSGLIDLPKVTYEPDTGIVFLHNKIQYQLKPTTLRILCQSALSVDELTGEQLITENDLPDDLRPLSMTPVGNYAIGIQWSDNHSSLIPYRMIFDYLEQSKSLK